MNSEYPLKWNWTESIIMIEYDVWLYLYSFFFFFQIELTVWIDLAWIVGKALWKSADSSAHLLFIRNCLFEPFLKFGWRPIISFFFYWIKNREKMWWFNCLRKGAYAEAMKIVQITRLILFYSSETRGTYNRGSYLLFKTFTSSID